jgi:hypothetical protein
MLYIRQSYCCYYQYNNILQNLPISHVKAYIHNRVHQYEPCNFRKKIYMSSGRRLPH